MKKTFPDLPDWTFEMDEISAGVYEVVGKDGSGNSVSAKGIDLDKIITECRDRARRLHK
jgi:hypothetical protein